MSNTNFSKMKIKELKEYCKKNNITGIEGLKKKQITEMY